MFLPYANRDKEIRTMIDSLSLVLPYPRGWYEQRVDNQVKAMHRKYADEIKAAKSKVIADRVKASINADQKVVDDRIMSLKEKPANDSIMLQNDDIMPVATKKHIVGTYELTVANRRSLRFKFIREDGTVAQAIVSRLMLRGFTLGGQTDCLPPRKVCMAWESVKVLTMTIDQMVAKITGSAINNPKELVQELYRIAGSTKQEKVAN